MLDDVIFLRLYHKVDETLYEDFGLKFECLGLQALAFGSKYISQGSHNPLSFVGLRALGLWGSRMKVWAFGVWEFRLGGAAFRLKGLWLKDVWGFKGLWNSDFTGGMYSFGFRA